MNPLRFVPFFAGLLSAALIPHAHAIPLTYTIAGGSVNANHSNPGLIINTAIASGLAGTSFVLDDGESSGWIKFARIWTGETTINADDRAPQAISATLDFQDLTSASVSGATSGGDFLGIVEFGKVEWNSPVIVELGDRTFSVTLTDKYFNEGIFGLNEGRVWGDWISAKVTQVDSKAVPDAGGTFALLGGALIGIAWLRRKFVCVPSRAS